MAYPYRGDFYERGPSPWVPVTILGVILLIATTPSRMASDAAAVGYPVRPAASGGIPPALIWIPIICYVVTQFLGTGSSRAAAYNRNERFPFRNNGNAGMTNYGNGEFYPAGGAYVDNYQQRYNNRTYSSTFMDYGGHWILIILGIWLFSVVTSPGPSIAAGGLGRRFGFPWSLFAPQPQIVLPML